jgi:HAE1 family hydrophobic/amphiphilic exporter-1
MTLSLAVIFVPLVFMGGVVGMVFREFAVTVVIAILCSGVISLTLTPMMCARMLSSKKGEESRVQKFTTGFLNAVIRKYGELLRWTLNRPFTTIIGWLICFAGTIALFAILPQSFIPEGDSGAFYGQALMPLGTSTLKAQKFQNQVNNIFMEDPAVDRMVTATGLQAGADQSTGPFFVRLIPMDKRKIPVQEVIKRIRKKTSVLTGGIVFMRAMPALRLSTGAESTAQGSKYSYVLTGPNQDELYDTALEFEKRLRKTPGFLDLQNSVKLDLPQLNIQILRDRASTLGITAKDIETALALAYSGNKVTTYKTDVDIYNVIVELEKDSQRNPENLSRIYLHSPVTGGLIPLLSVVKWQEGVGPQDVPHFNQLNCATISFNIDPNMPLSKATQQVEDLANRLLPPQVNGFLQGEAQQFKDAIASLGILIIIAIFIKYVILGILYENYLHPFTILTTLPVATFGGLLTLLIFGSELSLYAYVGIFMLLGIVAKNGIMMVDFANMNLEKGNISDLEAIYDACIVRFRPILMTGLAAIMGALPIALGYGADGASRQPLGLVVVGGLIFSQVVTLFITPGIFLYMQKVQEKYLDRWELTRSEAARKAREGQ